MSGSRLTRLRYQATLSALLLASITYLGVESFQVPGFFKFKGTPNYSIIWGLTFLFALFSVVSFYFQYDYEKRSSYLSGEKLFPFFIKILEDNLSELRYKSNFGPLAVYRAQYSIAERIFNSKVNDDEELSKYPELIDSLEHNAKETDKNINLIRQNWISFYSEIKTFVSGAERIGANKIFEITRIQTILQEVSEKLTSESSLEWYNSFNKTAYSRDGKLIEPNYNNRDVVNRLVEFEALHAGTSSEIHRLKELVLERLSDNEKSFDLNVRFLSFSMPFWSSVFIVMLSILGAIKNTYLFWAGT